MTNNSDNNADYTTTTIIIIIITTTTTTTTTNTTTLNYRYLIDYYCSTTDFSSVKLCALQSRMES